MNNQDDLIELLSKISDSEKEQIIQIILIKIKFDAKSYQYPVKGRLCVCNFTHIVLQSMNMDVCVYW